MDTTSVSELWIGAAGAGATADVEGAVLVAVVGVSVGFTS